LDMFHVGVKSLRLNELHLNTIGQNIANVNTPGYSRQRIVQETAESIDRGAYLVGSGVNLSTLERMRDNAMDTKFRKNNTELGYWNRSSEKLSELESHITGISTNLGDALDEFWNNWEAVSENPSSSAERISLFESTKNLTVNFNDFSEMIDDKRKEINNEIVNTANIINNISSKLATLSHKIDIAESQGKNPNDLLDQFDIEIDKLSNYGEVNISKIDGKRVIYFGTDEIVHDGISKEVMAFSTTDEDENYNAQIVWKDNYNKIGGLEKGELNGLLDLRDNILTEYSDQIDNLANQMVEKINSIHKEGFSIDDPAHNGILFFDEDTTGAGDIRISDELELNPNKIAASLNGEEGDNRVALQIAELRFEKTMDDKQSYNEYLNSIINKIGNNVSRYVNFKQAYSDTATQIENYRESVKGVSINEETANLIRFQQAYQASSKIISEANKVMSTVMGLVQ
ncbi:MAG: flagellar hook-associated protein FlgK, partial [Candidatus Cloacimonadota bacterium]|nr:flagellar hook-associated protein FlgK [Candidatus Cloacimonadota bacterium]